MASSFRVYVDESGDEGFKFLENESGSSRWFVQSAVVIRTENDRQMVAVIKEARRLLNKKDKAALHFRTLKHEQRLALIKLVAATQIRTVSVLIHKPSIAHPENFQNEAFSLYRYATRLLLERVSWLCRDSRKPESGDGTAELIFSNRSAMSYDDLRDYLNRLFVVTANAGDVRIDWKIIDPQRVRAVNHDQLAGLQVADAVATGMFLAVNKNQYGGIEPRYARYLYRTIYRNQRNRTLDGHGLKFWLADAAQKERFLESIKSPPE